MRSLIEWVLAPNESAFPLLDALLLFGPPVAIFLILASCALYRAIRATGWSRRFSAASLGVLVLSLLLTAAGGFPYPNGYRSRVPDIILLATLVVCLTIMFATID